MSYGCGVSEKKPRTGTIERIPYESDLCKAFWKQFTILSKLNFFGKRIYAFHVANERVGGDKTDNHKQRRYLQHLLGMGLVAGVADYCIMLEGGRVAFMEFKRTNKSTIRDSQKEFAAICAALSIPYVVVWSVEDAISWLKTL